MQGRGTSGEAVVNRDDNKIEDGNWSSWLEKNVF